MLYRKDLGFIGMHKPIRSQSDLENRIIIKKIECSKNRIS